MTTQAGQLKTILGAVEKIDTATRKVLVIDESGTSYGLNWNAVGYLDEKMAKLKDGYYREFTCEGTDAPTIISIKYLDSPEWVKQRYKNKQSSGGRPPTSRNEKPVIFESVFKSCCDQADPGLFQDQTYEQKMDRIWAVAKKIGEDIVHISGA